MVLLLSATVDPGMTSMVARRDPMVRLKDYETSLRFWLASGAISKIVMFENSGYDIRTLKAIASDFPSCDVEFHSFAGNQSGASLGKGHAELLGISRTLKQSQLIRNADLIVKCTGRLWVSNSRELFPRIAERAFDVMCTLKQHLSFADARFFAATPEFINDYLVPRNEMINDAEGIFLEHALACATAKAIADRGAWRPFPNFPVIKGISGTYGTTISDRWATKVAKSAFYKLRTFVYRS